MTEEELRKLQEQRDALRGIDDPMKFANDPDMPNPQAELLRESSDPYVQSLFEDQVKSENLEIAKQKKKTLQQPNHRRSNSAFTDMWFLGLLTLLLEPLMIFLVYLFIK